MVDLTKNEVQSADAGPRSRKVWIGDALLHGLKLDYDSFRLIDGEWTVDGMYPADWIYAVCGCEGDCLATPWWEG